MELNAVNEALRQKALKRAAQIAKRHQKGETLESIAASLGISRQRVHQIVKRVSE